jgi:hypothetical protein
MPEQEVLPKRQRLEYWLAKTAYILNLYKYELISLKRHYDSSRHQDDGKQTS